MSLNVIKALQNVAECHKSPANSYVTIRADRRFIERNQRSGLACRWVSVASDETAREVSVRQPLPSGRLRERIKQGVDGNGLC
jgi:hypothetical protein